MIIDMPQASLYLTLHVVRFLALHKTNRTNHLTTISPVWQAIAEDLRTYFHTTIVNIVIPKLKVSQQFKLVRLSKVGVSEAFNSVKPF
jgi:hypothetical protein